MDSLVLEALAIIKSEGVPHTAECQEKLQHLILDGCTGDMDAGNPLVHEVEKKTVLQELIKSGMAETLSELLLKFPVDLNASALNSHQDISALAWTLTKENAKDDPDIWTKPIDNVSELTPLTLACYAGHKNTVQVLIRAGAMYKTSMNLLSNSISDSCKADPVAMVIKLDNNDCFEVFLNDGLLEIVDLNTLLTLLLINKAVGCLECVSSRVSSHPTNNTDLLRLAEGNGMRYIKALLRMGFSYTQMHASMSPDALEKYYLHVGLQHNRDREQFEASCAEFTDLFLTGGGMFDFFTSLEERHIRALMMRLCKFYGRKLFHRMCNDRVTSFYADIRSTIARLGRHPHFTCIPKKMHDKFVVPYLTYIASWVSRQRRSVHTQEYLELVNTLYEYQLPVKCWDSSKIVTMQFGFLYPHLEQTATEANLCKIYPKLIELKISVLRNQLCQCADIDEKQTIVSSWLKRVTFVRRHCRKNVRDFIHNLALMNAILHMVSSYGIWLQDLPVHRNFYGLKTGRCSFLQIVTQHMSIIIKAFPTSLPEQKLFKLMILLTAQFVNLKEEIKHDLGESSIILCAYKSILIDSDWRLEKSSIRCERRIKFCQFVLTQIPYWLRQEFIRKMNILQTYVTNNADDAKLVGLKRSIDSMCEVDTLYSLCLLRCRSYLMSPPVILVESSESDTSASVGFLNEWEADTINSSPLTGEEMMLCLTNNSPLQQNVNRLTIPKGLKMDIIGIDQLKDILKSMK